MYLDNIIERLQTLFINRGKQLLERFSIAFTANGKRQAEISRLPKTREIYLVSAYILPVSHSYGASTKNREISFSCFYDKQQPAVCCLMLAVNAKLSLSVGRLLVAPTGMFPGKIQLSPLIFFYVLSGVHH